MYKELKKVILEWLIEHEHDFDRVNTCHKYFRQYIYDDHGEYIIGGKDTSDFIENADKLLYG